MNKPTGTLGAVLYTALVLLALVFGLADQASALTSSIVINTEARTVNEGTSIMFSGQITIIDEQGPRGLAYAQFQIMDELTREIIYTGQADSVGMYSFYWTASQLDGMSTRTLKATFPGTYYYPPAENAISVTVYAQPDIHKPVVDEGLDADLSDYDIIIGSDGHQKDCYDCYSNSHLYITQGESLSWFNNDDRQHKIRITGPADAVESPILKRNKSFSHKFFVPGQYNFVCTIHPWATGTVDIEPYAKEQQETKPHQPSERMTSYFVNSGDHITLAGLFTIFENQTVFWKQISGTPVELSDPYSLEPSFVAPYLDDRRIEHLIFEFIVADKSGETLSDTVQVSVLPRNSSPIIDAGPDQTAYVGDIITLNGDGIDPDGDHIYYRWSQISGQSVDLLDPDTSSAQFTVPMMSPSEPLVFELTISDDFGGTSSDTVEIYVKQSSASQQTQESVKSGCLIATAAFGTELAPQVQLLREVRDGVLYNTGAGTTFMIGFNKFYYVFSPAVADLERQSPLFKEVVKTAITPMLSTLSILNYANIDSEQEMLGHGIGVILLNIGMYFVAPAIIIKKLRRLLAKK